jgi:hypothetical protein
MNFTNFCHFKMTPGSIFLLKFEYFGPRAIYVLENLFNNIFGQIYLSSFRIPSCILLFAFSQGAVLVEGGT